MIGDLLATLRRPPHPRVPRLADYAARQVAELRRRLEIICERAGLDEGRARAWTIVREADKALGLGDDPTARDRVSLAVMIIKAMND